MTNQHSNIALDERITQLEKSNASLVKTVAQMEKLCYRLFDKKKRNDIPKDAAIKKKISDLLRKNIDQNNALVAKRIHNKQPK